MALTALQAYNLEKALGRGSHIEAIKLYREATGCDLTTAKLEVDKFAAELKERKPWLFKDQPLPSSTDHNRGGGTGKARFTPRALVLFLLVDALIFAGIIYYFVFYQPERRSEHSIEPRHSQSAPSADTASQGHPASETLSVAPKADSYAAAINPNDTFASLYREKIQSRDYIRRKSSPGGRHHDDSEIERKIKSLRSELARQRAFPDGEAASFIPSTAVKPRIDGIIDPDEWQDASNIVIDTTFNTRLSLQTDGQWLFIACNTPAETTAGGFDQLRVYFHAGLDEGLVNERIHVGRSSGVTSIRQTRFRWQGPAPTEDDERWKKYNISDWGLYQYAVGTSSMAAGHRQYEAAIHLGEAGLHPGVPFTFYAEVETDPLRNSDGKFMERRYLGQHGSEAQPAWLVY